MEVIFSYTSTSFDVEKPLYLANKILKYFVNI